MSAALNIVIMAGGSGTRMWPMSRTAYPKQFLNLNSDNSMLQETIQRLHGLSESQTTIITNEEHRFLVAEHLRQLNKKAEILLEPVGRNTAPAIALAAFRAQQRGDGDQLLLVLAADHVIENSSEFRRVVQQALPIARDGKLVTFGIVPDSPATGYGYIRQGEAQAEAYKVDAFVEKPDLATAEQYLASGEYLWNSGMFLFRADRYLEELKEYRADIYQACEAASQNLSADLDFLRINKTAFEACPDDSIDYAVMEKTDQAVVLPLDAGWSDVGSWSALWDIKEKDQHGNVHQGDVIDRDSHNNFVITEEKLVATIGVDNLVIVDTKDAVLVADRNRVQEVKDIVGELKQQGRSEHVQHREVYRPWGKYDSIDAGERYQVKRITVNPGAKLSLQKHHHRAEHWIVVSGTAKVTNGDKTLLVSENESTYIPIGVVHCLENPGKIPLELIEVQSGSYLGEDDIVRLQDDYGRG
ncbi:mannose-1-phosphate guanylyltransferase/mannose-6-phosphate isomerase [Pseudoteredinibacter isoporae]|uniref:mannose-1-phosphate guanylyltransferase n=1 Tax=Pseudoteredinibacter isoporae TaxID=570281 RepID=A0A7X0JTC7_9GAMM|nr:mannose-1-phosphate guanylyltransferase/mannose-6-phosphate isomerase [Pseudoteredinibacter isoporae]MBB6520971.1 mannose-1-phosphate guanylyltransferase [Pseudoteredinibacter isoporae]